MGDIDVAAVAAARARCQAESQRAFQVAQDSVSRSLAKIESGRAVGEVLEELSGVLTSAGLVKAVSSATRAYHDSIKELGKARPSHLSGTA